MEIDEWLKIAKTENASDLYLKAFVPPVMRVYGQLRPLPLPPLKPEEIETVAQSIMNPLQKEKFVANWQVNLAYWKPDIGRFRVNVFRQKDTVACVFREVKTEIPSFEILGLPPFLKQLVLERQGLILITGAAGMGKSTTLAAMIEYRNQNSAGHIITVEEPIEYLHEDKQSLVSQREIGMDAISYHEALRDALRQTPDVIVIGEMRDLETVSAALHFAETGHLVLSTLHSVSASLTLERLVSFFPAESRFLAFMGLALNLRAVVAQKLLPKSDGHGMALACEILVNTPYVRELISAGNISGIQSALQKGAYDGMMTLDDSIFTLLQAGLISKEEAIASAYSPNEMKLRMKGLWGRDF